ncbi:hypothetical protein [Metaplanococcus flavidus]|uniref:Uncharacterized protein n=1 Tax=Metaplanococcus flavidus TaxID=569883 RepID=A0ABW3LF97_9BACL
MGFRGKILITDEAVEIHKKVNLFSAQKVDAKWHNENQALRIDCEPSNLSFNWSWEELNKLLEIRENVVPSAATAVRDRDAIAIIFCDDTESELCKSHLNNGNIYEFGILASDGFSKMDS